MNQLHRIKNWVHCAWGLPRPNTLAHLTKREDVLSVGRRSYSVVVSPGRRCCVRKLFSSVRDGRIAFRAERHAQTQFQCYKWFPQWTARGLHWYEREWFPDELRLDRVAGSLDEAELRRVAGEALSILLDIHTHGWAHRDFHARNLFYVDGQLKLIDYESATPVPDNARCGFWESYDMTGYGLPSPWLTSNRCFLSDSGSGMKNVLQVDASCTRRLLADALAREISDASRTFAKNGGRHTLRSQLPYGTLQLGEIAIGEAQRNCIRRFERFGMSGGDFGGKKVLDLGANIGAMSFQAMAHGACGCVGVEFDRSKVHLARKLAAYAGLKGVEFMQGDLDRIRVRRLPQSDIVLCLAVVGHLKRPHRLYSLLGRVTKDVVLFEGNAKTKVDDVVRGLRQSGFRSVEFLGMCDDDILSDNNCRPLIRAAK